MKVKNTIGVSLFLNKQQFANNQFLLIYKDPNSLAPCSLTKFFGFWMFINSSFGTLFNGMIIYVYIKNKELQSPTNAFIVSINICDVLACLLEMPLPMIANFSCK